MWDFMQKPDCNRKPPSESIKELEAYRRYVYENLKAYYKKICEGLSVSDPDSLNQLHDIIANYREVETSVNATVNAMKEQINSLSDAKGFKDLGARDILDDLPNRYPNFKIFNGVKRKVIAITSGLKDVDKKIHTITPVVDTAVADLTVLTDRVGAGERAQKCWTTYFKEGSQEGVNIYCGSTGRYLKLRTDRSNNYGYRIANFNGFPVNQNSVYVDTPVSSRTLVELNIDDTEYHDFSVLHNSNIEFTKLVMIYTSSDTYNGAPCNCTTTIIVTANGLTVIETVDSDDAVARFPVGVVKDSNGYVKVKANHETKFVFAINNNTQPPHNRVWYQSNFVDGRTSVKKFRWKEFE